ncbi:MAG TPA: hypothetical protein VI895_12615 [Bdellovibrionota bacterium]|nr:hypothetical protein [Bdellovibrionota bacterium]
MTIRTRCTLLSIVGVLAHLGCQAQPVQWPIHEYRNIPFTNFNTTNHKLELEFLADKLGSRFRIDGATLVEFPENMLPLKALETSSHRLLVICKSLFSGELTFFGVETNGSSFAKIRFPSKLTYSLFKEATIHKKELLIILYDVQALENKLYRWEISDDGVPIVDENYYSRLWFNGRYEVDANIFMAEFQGSLYFSGEGVCYVYTNDGAAVLTRHELGEKFSIVEMIESPFGIAALFQSEEADTTPFVKPAGRGSFKIIDLQTFSEVGLEDLPKLPYSLRYENGWKVSGVNENGDFTAMLEFDLRHRSSSSMYDLGGNNFEGRVAWAQVYYLNGLLDVVKKWDKPEVDFDFLGSLREKMKLRLDLEMYLLDRLLDEGNPGFLSRRYSVDRVPVIHAVQTGRILRLFKRYLIEVEDALPLTNYEKFLERTQKLEGHIEVLSQAISGDLEITPGQYYLKWPKGSAFWSDGVAIPYNHQDDWAGGVAYNTREEERGQIYLFAAKDIISNFLTNEGFYKSPPKIYQWRYWWGKAWTGWTSSEGVSVNTPDYPGARYMAHISYRTIDVMATLAVGRIYPEILPKDFLLYAKKAVEQNGIYPFAMEELTKENIFPEVPADLAALYARVKSPWELQNAVWSILSLKH